MTGFLEALNALDADAMAGYFADDITAFVPIAQPQRADGKAAVTAIFRDFAAQTKKTTARINITPDHLVVQASGDFGLVSFETIPGAMLNRRTFVFRRIGGKWLIVHIHASNLPVHS
jgi:ketosteroid isomerase-like protein